MSAPALHDTTRPSSRSLIGAGDSALARRLAREIAGEVLFDPYSRGRYATDASIYQIEPIGVVVPRDAEDAARAIGIAAEEGVPVLPRGAGTSQCGQAVGAALVLDLSKHLDRVHELDLDRQRALVGPGLVLDRLNGLLKPHGLFFAVDVSTSSRATLGGMTGNNSCGARSIRYGTMRDNVLAVDALLADGSAWRFGEVPRDLSRMPASARPLAERLLALGRREAAEIDSRFPKLQRRVGGYNIDALMPGGDNAPPPNLAHLLVGSEGTLAFSKAIEIRLQPIPRHRVLGVCHFPSFYKAMEMTQHIVKLGPSAVELVDSTMIELSRDIPIFATTVERFVRGTPEAVLLVEFAGEDESDNLRRLGQLGELLNDFGFPDAVVEATDRDFQAAIWEVRKAGLDIMMSMKGDGKPVSFIEDCAVPLEDLADYTERLTAVFKKHGTDGTWYAHASVGCLHVRPILNLKQEIDVRKLRAIAEEAFAMVREYKGSHSGEHGDGLVRSEFHEAMFGRRMTAAFKEVKAILDPKGLFNPGKIVDPPKMDDRSLFRYRPDYRTDGADTALDWSAWGGFAGAVEMCNNNGACRKLDAGVMCPSFRVTRDEQHLTRGRANTLRLALSNQLGPEALASDEMVEALKLCVSCKGCKRECPTGVDMARMKVEVLRQRVKRHGLSLRDRLVAYLPRYAPWAARVAPLLNLRNESALLAKAGEALLGFSAKRSLPAWRRDPFRPTAPIVGPEGGRELVLLADSFNGSFEPENLHAALRVLVAGGYRVYLPVAVDGSIRPLCCGRTFLAAGLVEQARVEQERLAETLAPYVARGIPIVGLEPSCLLTLRDELLAILPGAESEALSKRALLFEEFLAAEARAGRLVLPLKPLAQRKALLHGHCHQKAFAALGAVETVLGMIPDLRVETLGGSCCGMAGAFGYCAETYEISMKMGEMTLLPAVRAASQDILLVADGTSCRHQIKDSTGREALHVARVLAQALD